MLVTKLLRLLSYANCHALDKRLHTSLDCMEPRLRKLFSILQRFAARVADQGWIATPGLCASEVIMVSNRVNYVRSMRSHSDLFLKNGLFENRWAFFGEIIIYIVWILMIWYISSKKLSLFTSAIDCIAKASYSFVFSSEMPETIEVLVHPILRTIYGL